MFRWHHEVRENEIHRARLARLLSQAATTAFAHGGRLIVLLPDGDQVALLEEEEIMATWRLLSEQTPSSVP